MEIDKQQYEASQVLFQRLEIKDKLEKVYAKIPSGQCDGCAKCCTESVPAFYAEFLNIHQYLIQQDLLSDLSEKVEAHYFHELTTRQDCPFLKSDKSCAIYPVRPLTCRLFGYASRDEHESSYEKIAEMNQAADDYFYGTYKVHIPEEVLYHKINYCEYFIPGARITQAERQQMMDRLFQLDTHFLMAELIPEEALNMSITNWFIYLKYNEETASKKRIDMLLAHS